MILSISFRLAAFGSGSSWVASMSAVSTFPISRVSVSGGSSSHLLSFNHVAGCGMNRLSARVCHAKLATIQDSVKVFGSVFLVAFSNAFRAAPFPVLRTAVSQNESKVRGFGGVSSDGSSSDGSSLGDTDVTPPLTLMSPPP